MALCPGRDRPPPPSGKCPRPPGNPISTLSAPRWRTGTPIKPDLASAKAFAAAAGIDLSASGVAFGCTWRTD
jgi:hypothetical protein